MINTHYEIYYIKTKDYASTNKENKKNNKKKYVFVMKPSIKLKSIYNYLKTHMHLTLKKYIYNYT